MQNNFDQEILDQDTFKYGLTSEQVEDRVRHGLINEQVDSNTRTVGQIITSNVFTYFNLVFAVLAALLIMVGSFKNLTFLPIIIANTLIGIVQELRSKKVLDKLNMLNAPHTKTIRNGKEIMMDSTELVKDDIVIFEAGNQIPADAIIIEGNVSVNESLLTGEADEVQKTTDDELMSGSFIVSGTCKARLDKVGRESYISQLTLEATKTKKKEQSEMIRSLDKLVKGIGIVLIPIGVIMVVQQYFFNGATLQKSVTGMVAAVLGMIPEGLYLLASIALVVSTMRLAKQQVLLHDMKCIETLARVDVLCVDKTGTITVPDMEVSGFKLLEGKNKDECFWLLSDFVTAMANDNATMDAMKKFFNGDDVKAADEVFSFSSAYKYSAARFGDDNYVLGAPEFILKEKYEDYADNIEEYTDKGYRVVVFGKYDGELDGEALKKPVTPLCFVFLSNAIRAGAENTFAYFARCGVEIKVISGDNPRTVSEISIKAGIENADKYIDASTLKDYDQIYEAIQEYTVFGRVTPEQKRLFVQALQEQGRTVAMTGDGVNDVLALKDADCSVAMASGSDAASNVAQIVLMDSDFSRMPSVVLEGRRVVNNIQRSASLFLVKNIFSLLMALMAMIFVWQYPLEPSQISLVGAFTIGIPSFFLALEPNKNRIRGHFLTNVFLKALPGGLTTFIVIGSFVFFCYEFKVDTTHLSSASTIIMAIVGFMILYKIALPMTKWHATLIIALIIGCLGTMIIFRNIFSMHMISDYRTIMLFVIFAICTEPIFRYLYQICSHIQKKVSQRYTR